MKHQDCYMFYEDRAHTCSEIDALRDEIETLRAQIQAVREVRHTLTNLGDFMFLDQALGRILNALDGDNDA